MHGLYIAAAVSAAVAAAAATGSGVALAWTRQQEEQITKLKKDAASAGARLESIEQECERAHGGYNERLLQYQSTANLNAKRLDSTNADVRALRKDVDWLRGLYSAAAGGGGDGAGAAGGGDGGGAASAAAVAIGGGSGGSGAPSGSLSDPHTGTI
jgi:TolA-binding protein